MSQGHEPIETLFMALMMLGATASGEHAQGARAPNTSAAPTVVIVIDDTQVRAGDGANIAGLVDTLERDLLDASATVGVATVGPAGLNIDLTRDRARLREVAQMTRAGGLDFKRMANPEMEEAARLATLEPLIPALASKPGPKAVVIVGREAVVAAGRRQKWAALRRVAQGARVAVAWLDLGPGACAAGASATDAALVAGTGLCAPLSNKDTTTRVIQELRRHLLPY